MTDAYDEALAVATKHAAAWHASLADRPVAAPVDPAHLRSAFGSGPLADDGAEAAPTIEQLVRAAEPGLVAEPGPR